jgi:acetyl esterase/lipase
MRESLRRFAAVVLAGAIAQWGVEASMAQDVGTGRVVELWPEGVPGLLADAGPEVVEEAGRVSNVHVPTLTAYPAPGLGRRSAVIVCPGGAYRRLALDHEGRDVAEWLNSLGITAFVLKYRLKEYGHPAPLRDVLRAVRLLRANADAWRIDGGRLGILGFSAGGHLASAAGTLFDAPEGRTGADLDGVSARPDFLVLVYPVITLHQPLANGSSRDNLLGATPDAALVDRLSTDRQVTAATPPTFLVHGGTDDAVPAENSVLFYSALRRHGVPAELHLYERGPHGVGMGAGHGAFSGWTARCAEWLAARGLTASAPAK